MSDDDLISLGVIPDVDLHPAVAEFLEQCGNISDEHDHGVLIYRSEDRLVIELHPLNVLEVTFDQDDEDDDDAES